MSEENDWALSFNPRTDEDLDVDAMKEALSPFALSVTRKSEHRYEIILDDELPYNPPMGEVITKVIFLLGELYPAGVIVGHLDDEPEY